MHNRVKFGVTCVVSLFISSVSANMLDGPLTDVSSTAPAKTQEKNPPTSMPAPAATQFFPQAGGAPTGQAQGVNVQSNLPPVVDATGGQTLNQPPAQSSAANSQSSANNNPVNNGGATASGAGSSTTPANNGAMFHSTANGASANSLTLDQRTAKLEQQMANITRMNLPQQVSDIQMQLQQLSGQLQVQEHDIKLLNTQQRNFYQDLDQRLKKVTNPGGGNSSGESTKKNISSGSIQLEDSNAYKAAIDLLVKKKYTAAQNGLLKYLSTYPNGQFTVRAHYWLGQIYFINKDYTKAAAEFNTVVNSAPKSPQVPDAKLKLAMINLYAGKVALAKQAFNAIKKQYPNSTAAQLAIIQLKQLDL